MRFTEDRDGRGLTAAQVQAAYAHWQRVADSYYVLGKPRRSRRAWREIRRIERIALRRGIRLQDERTTRGGR